MARKEEVEVFRTAGWLRGAVAGATVFWMLVFFLLVGLGNAPVSAYLGAGFFILFFVVIAIFYNNSRLELSAESLVVRSPFSHVRVPLSAIASLQVRTGLFQTLYELRAGAGPVYFTNIFVGHRRLRALLEERMGLRR